MNEIVVITLLVLDAVLSFEIKKILYGRSIPLQNKRLDVVPTRRYEKVSTAIQCATLCGNTDCKSFNYDRSTCELLDTYLCDDTTVRVLVSDDNYRYYDVEYTEDDIDLFYNTEECILHGRCSPKCFVGPSTADTTTIQTTSPLATASSIDTTDPTTSMTTTPVATTSTNSIETTNPTSSLTTTPPANSLPINNPCTSSADCTVTNSECRDSKCQCEPGYSLRIYSNTVNCVTACDVGYSSENNADGFTETKGHYLNDHPINWFVQIEASSMACIQSCIDLGSICLSVSYVTSSSICYGSGNTKLSANANNWKTQSDASYFQRNCEKR